jgi:hypothetical protein
VLLHTSRTSWHKLSQAITAAKLNRRASAAPAKARHDDYHVKKMCHDLMETFTLVYLVRPSIHRIASTTRICMVVKVTVFPVSSSVRQSGGVFFIWFRRRAQKMIESSKTMGC